MEGSQSMKITKIIYMFFDNDIMGNKSLFNFGAKFQH